MLSIPKAQFPGSLNTTGHLTDEWLRLSKLMWYRKPHPLDAEQLINWL
jgi:hypothetical protein